MRSFLKRLPDFLLKGLVLLILLNAKPCMALGADQSPDSPALVLLTLNPAIHISNSVPDGFTQTNKAPASSNASAMDTLAEPAHAEPAIRLPVPPMDFGPLSSSGFYNVFDHSKPSRFWISAQTNIIPQYHPSFHSAYSGANSFYSGRELKTSILSDLYLGCEIAPRVESFLNIERFDGTGLSSGRGLGGLPDLDVIRDSGSLGGKFYIARAGIHAVIPLSHTMVLADRSPANLSDKLPERRFEIRVGKFSATDFFNCNSAGSDTHHQFMNWTVDNDGWYDYPADTRGYTCGAMLEYQSPRFAARFF